MAREAAKHAYVALDFEKEALAVRDAALLPALQRKLMLPDGLEAIVDAERFCSPEALFNPALVGKASSSVGVHQAISNA